MTDFFIKRSATADKRPDPALLANGELALNANSASPGLFFKTGGGDLVKAGPTHVGPTAPNATAVGYAGNCVGESWLDTTINAFKVYDGSSWTLIFTASTLPFDLLPSTAGVHLYSMKKQITDCVTPIAFCFDNNLGNVNLMAVPTWTNSEWINALLWMGANTADASQWFAETTRWYDQTGTRPLQGNGGDNEGPLNFHEAYQGQCDGLFAPVAITDRMGRVMVDGAPVTRQDGNACWYIAVFDGNQARVPNNAYLSEFSPSINNFVANRSLQVIRNGTNNTIILRPNATEVGTRVNYTNTSKNVLLYCDRGPGTTCQFSINGGPLTDGAVSSNIGYQNGVFAVGGSAVTSGRNGQNWNAGIATVAYWVGNSVDMPSNDLLKQIADLL